MKRESLLGELEGRRDDLCEASSSEAGQDCQERVRYRGRTRGEHACQRNEVDLVCLEPLDRGGPWRDCVAVDGEHRALRSDVTERGELSAEGMHVRVEDAFRERRCDCGVEGVSASVEDAQAGLGRKVVLRHHHAAGAHQRRSLWHELPV